MTSFERPEPATNDGLVKIWFKFVPREGWLPFDTEGLWAEPVGQDTARLRNVPFLAVGVAEADIWRYVTLQDGQHFAVSRVEASGNCTIRVLPDPRGPLGRSGQRVHEKFVEFGMGSEIFSSDLPLVAFNVPAGANLVRLKELLLQGERDGWWYVEASCITPEWHAV